MNKITNNNKIIIKRYLDEKIVCQAQSIKEHSFLKSKKLTFQNKLENIRFMEFWRIVYKYRFVKMCPTEQSNLLDLYKKSGKIKVQIMAPIQHATTFLYVLRLFIKMTVFCSKTFVHIVLKRVRHNNMSWQASIVRDENILNC